jgi:hypothetical protein
MMQQEAERNNVIRNFIMFTPLQLLMGSSYRGVKVDRACIIHTRELHSKFWQEKPKERDNWEDMYVDSRDYRMLKKYVWL